MKVPDKIKEIRVFNSNGTLVSLYKEPGYSMQINLDGYGTGIYYLHFIKESAISTEKVIISPY